MNIGLLADVYHLTSNGEDVTSALSAQKASTRHVQIADSSGRHEPGTGSIDFSQVFQLLAESGYKGYIGLEYRPLESSEEGLTWLPNESRAVCWTRKQVG